MWSLTVDFFVNLQNISNSRLLAEIKNEKLNEKKTWSLTVDFIVNLQEVSNSRLLADIKTKNGVERDIITTRNLY